MIAIKTWSTNPTGIDLVDKMTTTKSGTVTYEALCIRYCEMLCEDSDNTFAKQKISEEIAKIGAIVDRLHPKNN